MAELDRAEICLRIQQAREAIEGLTQEDVAGVMNVTPRTVQYWESAKDPKPPMERLSELAGVLKTTKEWLLHGDAVLGPEKVTKLEGEVADLRRLQEELLVLVRELREGQSPPP